MSGGAGAIPFADPVADHAPLAAALEEAAVRVVRSGRYILGPEVAAFEAELASALGVAHAVGVSSGTDALIATLLALGVGPGDEVLTSPFSFFATAGAIARVGARPTFVDLDDATLNLDVARAAEALGPRTRAVVLVHLFGRVADPGPLAVACAARGIPLLEDAAQAIGAATGDHRRAGALGAAAALSFFPTKNLGGFGDGGAVLTGDADLAACVRRLRVHGAERKNHHVFVGGNFRLDELQAALLRVKLPYLSRWIAARRTIAAAYRGRLMPLAARGALALPPEDPGATWSQFVVRVAPEHRDALARHLGAIGVATEIYYPRPLPLQPALAHLGYAPGAFPTCERAAAEVLALPIYPSLSHADVDRVADGIASYVERAGAVSAS